ncbi:MAG: hypothetical protein ACYTGP_13445 [Planctomycetota bacterium]|jgi:hypothetical protein
MNPFLAITLAAATAIVPAFVANAQDTPRGPDEHSIIDVKFRGTTAEEFVEALRREAGPINVVFDANLESMQVSPVELKRVTVESAMNMLDELQLSISGNWVVTDVDMVNKGRRPPGALPVWRVRAKPSGPRSTAERPQYQETHVWTLATVLESGFSSDDVLTAVETALTLKKNADPVQLQFHRETKLLMGRGTQDQLETIDTLLHRLQKRSSSDELKAQLQASERASEQEITRLRAQLEDCAVMDRLVTQWQTRAELYENEMSTLREELKETRAILQDRDDKIRAMQASIDQLRRALPGTGR